MNSSTNASETPPPGEQNKSATGEFPAALTVLRGVGPAVAARLQKLHVQRPEDLLFVLPQRYEDRTQLTRIGALQIGHRAVIQAQVEISEIVYRGRRSLLCRISDGTGQLTLRFFYFSQAQHKGLARGTKLRCYGEVRIGRSGLEMIHPEYQLLPADKDPPLDQHLTPIYPTTEGLQQFRLRKLIDQVMDQYLPAVIDWLPKKILAELSLPTLQESITELHRPPRGADVVMFEAGRHPAQRRLALEEILAHHLSLRRVKDRGQHQAAVPLAVDEGLHNRFLEQLGFALTVDQQSALEEIEADIERPHPMMRLLQGDVGCGKTVLAAAAALRAVAAGHQAAIMAPTELLAEQLRDNFQHWFEPLGVSIAWLSGSLVGKARTETYAAIASGSAQLIVGTHALFQEAVLYHSLALVIVDEQHRFGVHQRLTLMEKGVTGSLRPHQLVMTATPIPRTLAMTLFADLDVSSIRELPPGRRPVQTVALPEDRRASLVTRVREACQQGQRAYWVCPLIEDSDALDYQAAESTYAMLVESLPEIGVGLIHGRMRAEEKARVMKKFAAGKLGVLVATTVIEVGVNVPAATLMIIENSERMGLSQLHQLRGRVGRGTEQSSCVLLYKGPLSAVAKQRLAVLRNTNDGFEVAQQDLELRGPGEVLGKKQTGLMQLRVADLVRDAALLPIVQKLARHLLKNKPAAVEQLVQRWIGPDNRYGNV